jgi:hypothetical protein
MLKRTSLVPVTVLLLALSSNAAHASWLEEWLEGRVVAGRVVAPREIPRARYSFEIPSGKLTMPKKIGTIGPVQLKGGEVNLYRIGKRWWRLGVPLGYCAYINCKNEVLDRVLGKKDRQPSESQEVLPNRLADRLPQVDGQLDEAGSAIWSQGLNVGAARTP